MSAPDSIFTKALKDQGHKCYYTGKPLVLKHNAGLDMIDRSKGWIEGNIIWVDTEERHKRHGNQEDSDHVYEV